MTGNKNSHLVQMRLGRNYRLSALATLLVILCSIAAKAQPGHRVFAFKTGEIYQTDALISSKSVIQRGDQKLNVDAVSTVTRAYKVTNGDESGYKFNVSIRRMDNIIDALGNQLHYNSEEALDSTSLIKKSLNYMLNKEIDLQTDKYGVILSSTQYKTEFATDTLVAFAGIQPQIFEKGTLFNLVADLTYNSNLKKGYTWKDSVSINNDKLISKFWIEEIDQKTTIVKFSTSITGVLINSNTNGTYVIDNSTGLILEKLIYTVSTGYQISTGKVMYAVSRATSISERTKKVPK